MKNKFTKIIGALLLVAVIGFYGCEQSGITDTAQQEQLQPLPNSGDPIPGQYIIVFKDLDTKGKTVSGEEVHQVREAVLSDYAIPETSVLKRYNHALPGFAANLTQDQLAQLRNDLRIKYIEQDQFIVLAPPCGTPNGGSCDDDGGGGSGQTTPWGITRVGGAVDGTGLNDAWIIDTGIDLDHPDLNVDTQRSAEFVSRGPGSDTPDDGNGHGTHVAGTVAAIDNDIDVVGVAAGATVIAVKVLDDRGSGTYSDVIDGIDYVAANGASGDVANMSLGGGYSQSVNDAVANAASNGIFFSLAAGNDSDDANNYSPASTEATNVWTVSASDDTDTFASFSNWSGPTDPPIEHAAPGVDVLSLYKDGGTRTLSGTSMSAPHVAGVLLVTGGTVNSDGTVSSDPDGDPDPIAVHN